MGAVEMNIDDGDDNDCSADLCLGREARLRHGYMGSQGEKVILQRISHLWLHCQPLREF